MLERILDRMGTHRRNRRASVLALAALASLGALAAAASPALAKQSAKEEAEPFKECPIYAGAVACTVGYTTEGEFAFPRKASKLTKTSILQGGFANAPNLTEAQPLLGATNGETLSRTPEPAGSLAGLEFIGLEEGGEVTATAELAGPPSSVLINAAAFTLSRNETAVTLPLKIKLSNEHLGEECYIGSDSEPIVLHLRTGTTEPPSPATPIKGSAGHAVALDHEEITEFEHTSLVDNTFSVPGASGCGGAESAAVDETIDADIGLPAAAGESTTILAGSLEQTSASVAKKVIPKPKKAKTKKEGTKK